MPNSYLPTTDSLRGLLLTLVSLSEEFPTAQIHRLFKSKRYQKKVVDELKSCGLLRTYFNNGLRGLLPTPALNILMQSSYPTYFHNCLRHKRPTYKVTERLRLHRMAEVLVAMYNAGVVVFPWEKPPVFEPASMERPSFINHPVYYSSREIKRIGLQSNKIRNSRSTGVLLTDGGIFMVYNTADSQMKWEYRAEMRLKAFLQMEVCQRRLSAQFMDTPIDGIVFGTSMEQMASLMDDSGVAAHNCFVLDGDVRHFHYLTNDYRGEVILRLLCDQNRKAELNEILMEDLLDENPDWPVENDAMDQNGDPVLFGYTCDMPRIRKFDTGLALHKMTGSLICFDFQEESLRRICGPRVKFQSIDFESYERSVLHNPQRTD